MIVNEKTKAVAQSVVDYIKAHPESHDQREWVNPPKGRRGIPLSEKNICGTTMCAAGTTVFIVDGAEALNEPVYTFEHNAAEYLGLEYDEAMDLFYNMSNFHAVKQLEAIAAGDVEAFKAVKVFAETPVEAEVDSDV